MATPPESDHVARYRARREQLVDRYFGNVLEISDDSSHVHEERRVKTASSVATLGLLEETERHQPVDVRCSTPVPR